MRFLSDRERRERNQSLLSCVTVRQGDQPVAPTVNELSERSLKVLIKAGLEPGVFLLEAYRSLSLHPAEGKSSIDDLLARDYIKLHRLPRKGRGGQPVVVEVVQRGRQEMEKHGIAPAERRLKRGGWLHDVYARYIERWAKEKGYHVWFERMLGKKAFDMVYEDDKGALHGVEICLSGSVEWTAEQALKAAAVEGITRVIVACERKEFLQAVIAKAQEIDGLGLYRKKIVGKLLADYVPCE